MAIFKPEIYKGIGNYCYPIVREIYNAYYIITRKFTVEGKENIPKDTNKFLVVSNHFSNYDPPAIAAALTGRNVAFMAKEELYSIPFVGWGIVKLGAFSVNREKLEKTTIKATKIIFSETNWAVGMFLEGTRNKTPKQLGSPNPGPVFIANLNNVPILPIGITGTNNPKEKIKIKIGKIFYPNKDLNLGMKECCEKICELTGQEMPGSFV